MTEVKISLRKVLELVGDLCLDCQTKLRCRLATGTVMAQVLPATVPALAHIVAEVCKETRTNPHALIARGNHREIMKVRRMVVRRARAAGFSFPAIGRVLHRHHTSVIHLARMK